MRPRPVAPLADRFWAKVDRRGPEECWIWTGALCALAFGGYGHLGRGRRGEGNVLAHRVAYELLVGPIPPGLTIDHFRMNPGPRNAPCSTKCVNPAHLETVTMALNASRSGSPFARKARQTACHRGHAFDEKNTHVDKRGRRICRVCDRDDKRNSRLGAEMVGSEP
jgi:hypothetical protein